VFIVARVDPVQHFAESIQKHQRMMNCWCGASSKHMRVQHPPLAIERKNMSSPNDAQEQAEPTSSEEKVQTTENHQPEENE